MKRIVYPVFLLVFLFGYSRSQDQNDIAMLQLGQQYERSGDIENALKIYKKLYEKLPANFSFYDSYKRLLEYMKKYDEAIPIVERWLKNNPTDIAQMSYLGNDYMRIDKKNDAQNIWLKAISLNPNNINIYRTVAAIILEGRFYENALEFYLKGREKCNDNNAFIVEVASLYAILNNYDSAINEYLKLLVGNPNQLGYIQSLIHNYIEDPGFLKDAVAIVKNKIDKGFNDISFYYLLSWLYGEQKNYDDALSVYIKIEKMKNSNGIELYSFAERAFRDKSYEAASKAYKLVIDDYPKSQVIQNCRFGYAQCMEEISNKKGSKFLDSLSSFNKDFPASEAVPLYSGIIFIYEKLAKDYPNTSWSCESYYRIGNIKLNKFFDLDGSLMAFNQVTKFCPGNPISLNAILKIGDILLMQNKPAEASEKFNSISKYPQQNINLFDMAKFKNAEINYFLGNFDNALKQLEEITANTGADFTNDALLLLNFIQANKKNDEKILKEYSKAELLERQKKISESMAIYNNIVTDFPQSKLIDETIFKIACLESYLNNYTKALKLFEELSTRFPESMLIERSIFYTAEIYEFGLKDIQKAISNYDRLLKDYPNSLYSNTARKKIRELRGEKNL